MKQVFRNKLITLRNSAFLTHFLYQTANSFVG